MTKEFTISNDIAGNPEALRKRADADGYLFFKRVVNADEIREVRRDITRLCAKFGWLKENTEPFEGISGDKKFVEPEPGYMTLYNELLKLESFHTLSHDPSVTGIFDMLFGEPTLVHARNIARIIFPSNVEFTTPAHQDYVHIQGTPDTWTCWIPLGDCPKELGSLAVLPGSHKQGIYETFQAYGAGGLGIDTSDLPFEWAASNFEIGDFLTFHSHTIHKALPNITSDRLRLSVDYRYQGQSQPVVESSFMPHHSQVKWEDIYSGWKSEKYKYYWKNLNINWVDWKPKFHNAAGEPQKEVSAS